MRKDYERTENFLRNKDKRPENALGARGDSHCIAVIQIE